MLYAGLPRPEPADLAVVYEVQGSVLAIQSINQPGVYPHAISKAPVRGKPMCSAATLRAAMELENSLVPCIGARHTFAFLEGNIITMVVGPKDAETATD